MKKLRIVLSLLLVFSCCMMLVACTGGGEITDTKPYEVDFSKSQAKRVELRVWMDDDNGNLFSAIEKDFESKYTNIDVVFQHMATVESREKLKTYGQSGNGADIFQFPHDHMAQAILDDLVYQLPTDMQTELEKTVSEVAMDIATISYDEASKTFSKDGEQRLYAVPISIESVALYYNCTLLETIHGAEWRKHVPTTFEAFIEDMNAFNALEQKPENLTHYFASDSHWADQYFIQFIYSAFGWRPFGDEGNDDTAVGFTDQKLTDALTWMYNTLRPAINSTNHNSVAGKTMFEEGKLPFILTGPWGVNSFKAAGIDFEVTVLPTINGNVTKTFAGAQMLAAYKYSRHLDEATTFLKYMASLDAQEILYREEGDLPALKEEGLVQIEGLKDNQALMVTSEQLETSIPMPTIPAVTYYWGPGETMVTNIWNQNANIAEQQQTAENSYASKKNAAN